MPKPSINKPLIIIASLVAFLIILISNIEVLAKPYEPSAALSKNITLDFATFDDHKIHFASSGDTEKPGVVFIHGTPGGWQAFEAYLESKRLQQDFFMISVDRMGWGQSTLDPKSIDGNFELQAESIQAVLRQYPNKKWTVVGHSLGASIAPKVAMKSPDSIDSLLLLAGSLNPKLGKPRWYNWAASTWVISRLIGDSMKHSNREIMGLRKQLVLMDTELKQTQLDTDLLIMQGQKDKLVSPKNPAYAVGQWQSSFNTIEVISLADEGHFLPWNQGSLVVQSLYKLRSARNDHPN